jgi:hypothetical protein
VILDQQAVADDHDRGVDQQLAFEQDGDGIHRDSPDHRPALACYEHLAAGHVAAEAVRVADGNQSDPGRLGRDEAAAVARALARLKLLHLSEAALPAQHRLQTVVVRIGAEGRQPVESDTTASGVEVRFG